MIYIVIDNTVETLASNDNILFATTDRADVCRHLNHQYNPKTLLVEVWDNSYRAGRYTGIQFQSINNGGMKCC